MDNFFDFLNKMESNSQYKENNDNMKYNDEDIQEDEIDDNEVEENEIEDTCEEEEEEQNEEEQTNEIDIIEKSLDYAKSVLKVVKENFKGRDQRIMFETLRNTLNMYLGETYQPRTEQITSSNQEIKNESPMLKGSTITEDEWNKLDTNNLDAMNVYNHEKQIPIEQLTPKINSGINESKSRAYSKELPLAVRVNANGKPEVDLSKITSRDMDDMKVLMGLK